MTKNKYIAIATLILAALAVFLVLKSSNSTIKADFAVEDQASITKIFMSDKLNNKVTLKRVDETKWLVNDKYQARADGIDILMETVTQLRVKEPVTIAGRNNVIKWLASKSTKVEIYQTVYRINLFNKVKWFPHEKLTKVYYVGDETQDNNGTFMLMQGSDEPFICYIPGFRGFLSPRYTALESDWRNHAICDLKIGEIKSVRLEFPTAPDSSFEITRYDRNFELKALKNNQIINGYDTLKLLDFMSSFTNLNFEAFRNNMSKHDIDSITSQIPMAILTINDITGKAYKVKGFLKLAEVGSIDEVTGKEIFVDRDRFYGLVNDDKDFVFLQYFTFNQILRPISFFRPKRDKK